MAQRSQGTEKEKEREREGGGEGEREEGKKRREEKKIAEFCKQVCFQS